MVAATIRKIHAPNHEAAVLLVSGSPEENFPYTFTPPIKPVEFRGLKSQYLFIFAGGLLALFVLFIIMYMVGINQWVCIIFGVTSATLLVWLTFRLNEKYGTHGLMKLSARKSHPFHIINRKAISRLFHLKQASK